MNIYAAQASDGDNWADDSPAVPRTAGEENSAGGALLQLSKLPARAHQTLWRGMNTCRRPLIISPSTAAYSTGGLFTGYSANCFTSSHLKVKLN
ncbi:DUF444 family protein [Klebsiella quasipneumoniae subsp. similipneumoniae]